MGVPADFLVRVREKGSRKEIPNPTNSFSLFEQGELALFSSAEYWRGIPQSFVD
jgi:hypothetical protein